MEGTIRWSFEDGWWVVDDEYGNTWNVVCDDGNLCYMVERETDQGYQAGEFAARSGYNTGWLYPKNDGATFGINCQDEYIVENGQWVEQVA